MRFFAWLADWKRLKNKNIILRDANYRLDSHNELLLEQNRAYSIENFNAGRKIAQYASERKELVHRINLNRRPEQSKKDVEQEIEELFKFTPHS